MAIDSPGRLSGLSVVSPTGPTQRPCCIVLDFDGTLISEHLLTAWVLFLFHRAGWPARRRLTFLIKSLVRGAVAMIFSRWPACEALSVRTAFGAFRNVEEKSLEALVQHRATSGRRNGMHVLNLNPVVLSILDHLAASSDGMPEIHIVSRGSSRDAIRHFLKREDVCGRFESIGISVDAVSIQANDMETDGDGRYTGAIRGDIQMKCNRMERMPKEAIFIGDDEDERNLKQNSKKFGAAFLNWRRWKRAVQRY